MRKILLIILLLACRLVSARSYTTTFPNTESPISQGGNWLNGQTTGTVWTNVNTTPGIAIGTMIGNQGPPQQYADSTAVVNGTWGPDQDVSVTVKIITPTS